MPVPQRLPIVNSDDGQWGDILNQFLAKEHYDTGTDNAANGSHKTITIRPGTATAGTAPLKFSSGTLLSSPEPGAMEFNADTIYFTITTGSVRKTIAMYDDTSGATGDIYYRTSGGSLARLGIGSTGDVLKVTGGLPSWAAGGGGSPGGSNKQLQYNNSGSFAGATGFEYQSAAGPNVRITAQGDYPALEIKGSLAQAEPLQQWISDDNLTYASMYTSSMGFNGDTGFGRIAAEELATFGKFSILSGTTAQTTAKIALQGSTSGETTIQSAAVAGATALTLPASTGTLENVAKATRVDTNGSYTLTTDNVICLANAASGAITYTLPVALGNGGHRFYIKKTDSSANAVTISRASSDTIDGQTSQAINAQYQCYMLVSDNISSWFII